MVFRVVFTSGARKDVRAIHTYIANNDSLQSADMIAREIVRSALTFRAISPIAERTRPSC
jgi:hypothetical protein